MDFLIYLPLLSFIALYGILPTFCYCVLLLVAFNHVKIITASWAVKNRLTDRRTLDCISVKTAQIILVLRSRISRLLSDRRLAFLFHIASLCLLTWAYSPILGILNIFVAIVFTIVLLKNLSSIHFSIDLDDLNLALVNSHVNSGRVGDILSDSLYSLNPILGLALRKGFDLGQRVSKSKLFFCYYLIVFIITTMTVSPLAFVLCKGVSKIRYQQLLRIRKAFKVYGGSGRAVGTPVKKSGKKFDGKKFERKPLIAKKREYKDPVTDKMRAERCHALLANRSSALPHLEKCPLVIEHADPVWSFYNPTAKKIFTVDPATFEFYVPTADFKVGEVPHNVRCFFNAVFSIYVGTKSIVDRESFDAALEEFNACSYEACRRILVSGTADEMEDYAGFLAGRNFFSTLSMPTLCSLLNIRIMLFASSRIEGNEFGITIVGDRNVVRGIDWPNSVAGVMMNTLGPEHFTLVKNISFTRDCDVLEANICDEASSAPDYSYADLAYSFQPPKRHSAGFAMKRCPNPESLPKYVPVAAELRRAEKVSLDPTPAEAIALMAAKKKKAEEIRLRRISIEVLGKDPVRDEISEFLGADPEPEDDSDDEKSLDDLLVGDSPADVMDKLLVGEPESEKKKEPESTGPSAPPVVKTPVKDPFEGIAGDLYWKRYYTLPSLSVEADNFSTLANIFIAVFGNGLGNAVFKSKIARKYIGMKNKNRWFENIRNSLNIFGAAMSASNASDGVINYVKGWNFERRKVDGELVLQQNPFFFDTNLGSGIYSCEFQNNFYYKYFQTVDAKDTYDYAASVMQLHCKNILYCGRKVEYLEMDLDDKFSMSIILKEICNNFVPITVYRFGKEGTHIYKGDHKLKKVTITKFHDLEHFEKILYLGMYSTGFKVLQSNFMFDMGAVIQLTSPKVLTGCKDYKSVEDRIDTVASSTLAKFKFNHQTLHFGVNVPQNSVEAAKCFGRAYVEKNCSVQPIADLSGVMSKVVENRWLTKSTATVTQVYGAGPGDKKKIIVLSDKESDKIQKEMRKLFANRERVFHSRGLCRCGANIIRARSVKGGWKQTCSRSGNRPSVCPYIDVLKRPIKPVVRGGKVNIEDYKVVGYRTNEDRAMPSIGECVKNFRICKMEQMRPSDSIVRKLAALTNYNCKGNLAPIPDTNDANNIREGLAKRVGGKVPEPCDSFKALFPEFVKHWIRKNDLYGSYIDLMVEEVEELINWEKYKLTLRYDPNRLRELEKIRKEVDELGTFCFNDSPEGEFQQKLWNKIEAHVKWESYHGEKKYVRMIFARSDYFKVAFGGRAKQIQKILYRKTEYFVTDTPVKDLPKILKEALLKYDIIFGTDFSRFESHNYPWFMQNCFRLIVESMFGMELDDELMRSFDTLVGKNIIENIFLWCTVDGKTMSGEVWTTIINTLTNIVVLAYILEAEGLSYGTGFFSHPHAFKVGFFGVRLPPKTVSHTCKAAGDDQIFGVTKLPWVDYNLYNDGKILQKYGVELKIDRKSSLSGSGFLSKYYSEWDDATLCDPLKQLSKGILPVKYAHSKPGLKKALARARAMSLLFEFEQCPIVSSYARCILRCTRNVQISKALVHMRKDDSYKFEQIKTAVEWYESFADKKNLNFTVGMDSRLVIEDNFGIPMVTQQVIEEYFDSVDDTRFPLEFDVPCLDLITPEANSQFYEDYTFPNNDKSNVVCLSYVPERPAFDKPLYTESMWFDYINVNCCVVAAAA